MKLPDMTRRQRDILRLLYRYRFLDRIQIQTLLRHKDRKTINLWLKDLTAKQYVGRIYSDHFLEKTKPAVYYLALNGVRFLRQQISTDESGDEYYDYPVEEVRKRYRDRDRSVTFRNRSMLLAGCAIDMLAWADGSRRYTFHTQADYADPDNEFHFLTEGDLASQLGPQLCITKQQEETTTHFLLEIFDDHLPQYRMSNRIKQYVTFLTGGDWEAERDDALPAIHLVCYRLTDLIYAKRRTRKLLADTWEEEKPHIRFTTVEHIQQNAMTGKIWEEA